MNEKRWALIGASNIAKEWMVDAIRATPGQSIGAVQSATQSRADEFAAAISTGDERVAAYDSVDAMLEAEKPDAVYISSTNEKHKAQTFAAAEAGAHVLCEKPLALSVVDAAAMIAKCNDAGVVLATNHHLRGAATHIKMRELVADGVLGDFVAARVLHAVYLPAHLQGWRLDDATGGGVIADITVHDADAVGYILQAYPRAVTAVSQNAGLAAAGVEDGSMSIWTMARDGADIGLCYAHESFAVRYAGTGLELHGSRASIIARDVMTQRAVGSVLVRDADGAREVEVAHHNLYEHAVGRFVAAMDGEGRPLADGVDGLRSLAVALAVKESGVDGRSVEVEYGGVGL